MVCFKCEIAGGLEKGEKMNKDYWEYYFSKKKKLTDRAFEIRIAMLMCSMVACAAVMASSAFALFTCDINRSTTLTAAMFNVTWNVTGNEDKRVTIEGPEGVVGYCKIVIKNPQNVETWYYTPAFSGIYTTTVTVPAEWQVSVAGATWGYPSVEPELIVGGSLTISEPEQKNNETEQQSGQTEIKLTSPRPTVSDDTPTVDIAEEKKETEEKNDKTQDNVEEKEQPSDNASKKKSDNGAVEKSSGTALENRLSETPVTAPVDKGAAAEKQKADSVQKTEAPSKVTEIKPAVSSGNEGSSGSNGGSNNGNLSGVSSDSGSSGSSPAPVASATSGSDSGGGSSASDGGGE